MWINTFLLFSGVWINTFLLFSGVWINTFLLKINPFLQEVSSKTRYPHFRESAFRSSTVYLCLYVHTLYVCTHTHTVQWSGPLPLFLWSLCSPLPSTHSTQTSCLAEENKITHNHEVTLVSLPDPYTIAIMASFKLRTKEKPRGSAIHEVF